MSASNQQRSRLSHKMWGKIREIGGSEVEIEKDPLGARYQVNKHGLIVTGSVEAIEDLHLRLVALLTVELWRVEKNGSMITLSHPFSGTSNVGDAVACIHSPYELPTGGMRMDIGIH
jgi:hypothetical protein